MFVGAPSARSAAKEPQTTMSTETDERSKRSTEVGLRVDHPAPVSVREVSGRRDGHHPGGWSRRGERVAGIAVLLRSRERQVGEQQQRSRQRWILLARSPRSPSAVPMHSSRSLLSGHCANGSSDCARRDHGENKVHTVIVFTANFAELQACRGTCPCYRKSCQSRTRSLSPHTPST